MHGQVPCSTVHTAVANRTYALTCSACSFICSSNNHISRIQGMVERLCSAYGTPLVPTVPLASAAAPAEPSTLVKQEQQDAGTPAAPMRPPPSSRQGRGAGIKKEEDEQDESQPVLTPAPSSVQEAEPAVSEVTAFYTFPTLQQLQLATEEELRAAGFGWVLQYIYYTLQTRAIMVEGQASTACCVFASHGCTKPWAQCTTRT